VHPAGRTAIDIPMLQGARDVIEGIEDPGGNRIARTAGNMASGFIPGQPNLPIADIASISDALATGTGRREPPKGAPWTEKVAAPVLSRIPGLRQFVPPKESIFGRPVPPPSPWNAMYAFDSTGSTAATNDPALLELQRLRIGIGESPRITTQPQKQRRGDLMLPAMRNFIGSSGYRGLSDEQKKQALDSIRDRATRGAR